MKTFLQLRLLSVILLMLCGVSITANAEDYVLVTDVSQLSAGDKIIIAASASNVAMSTTQNNNNRGQANITKSENGDKISNPGTDVQIITLEASTISDHEGEWMFNVGTRGYLYAAGNNKNNYLKSQTTVNANICAAISIGDKGVAAIQFKGTYTNNVLRYNDSNNLFSCYAVSNNQKDVCIYKLESSTPPVTEAELICIEISGELEKTTYYLGDAFSYKGLTVTALYDDDTETDVTSSCEFSNTLGTNLNKLGANQAVTITATFEEETATKTTSINVLDKLTGITLSGNYKKTFNIGEDFSAEGLVVTAKYLSGDMDVTDYVEISGYNMTQEGSQTITVTFEDLGTTVTATYIITVNDPNNVFTLLTDATDLRSGAKIIIAAYGSGTNEGQKFVAMGTQNTKYRNIVILQAATEKTPALEIPATLTPTSEIAIMTLGGTSGNWNFSEQDSNNKTVFLQSVGSGNSIVTDAYKVGYADATIALTDTTHVALIKFKQPADGANIIAYNYASPRISCYGTNSTVLKSSQLYLYYKPAPSETKHISSFKYASYVPSIDVTIPEESDVQAYILKQEGIDVAHQSATLTKLNAGVSVKAGTPMILYKNVEEPTGEDITFWYGPEANLVEDNLMQVATAGNMPTANRDYIFGQINGKVGFYQFEEGFTPTEGMVFVPGATGVNLVKGFVIDINDNNATCIKTVNTTATQDNRKYNLAGQTVGEGFRGIVVVNGKKVIK